MNRTMKADLIMWAKNGASTLPSVLKRIDEIIPSEIASEKIFVDDHSIDDSRKVANKFGWTVYDNPYGGVASGINEALEHVTAPFFISVERDLLLAENWFAAVSRHIHNPEVVVVSGEKAFNDETMQKMNEYWIDRQPKPLKGVNIDNALWRTDLFRRVVGDIPLYIRYYGADCYIYYKIKNSQYKSVLDTEVLSTHLRFGGIKEDIKKNYVHGLTLPKHTSLMSTFDAETTTKRAFEMAMFSPIRGLEVAIKKKRPQIFYHYPLVRFAFLAGMLKRRG